MTYPKFRFTLCLLALWAFSRSAAGAGVTVLGPGNLKYNAGCPVQQELTYSPTYDFSQAVTSTAPVVSNPIDWNVFGCFSFGVTITGAAQPVQIWTGPSQITTSTGSMEWAEVTGGSYDLVPAGRFLWFEIPPNLYPPTTGVPVEQVSVYHYLPSPTITPTWTVSPTPTATPTITRTATPTATPTP